MTKICRDKQLVKIDTLLQAVQVFRNWKHAEDTVQAVNLLTQMQEIAIAVGNILEQDMGDLRFMVVQLEQVCELLYQMSEELDNPQQIEHDRDKIEKVLLNLKHELEEITLRKEIVFMPYQVSMWDSLESVWLASKEDANVDSYVVPIPFFDIQPNRDLGELHYQGNDYEQNIPVTYYEQYWLEERHPDIIFIHNPYDECNMVTRVPQQYYASQLKEYTELLVYIPYFISPEGGPSDHQCYMPGVLFADRVIVQPDSIYETYCRVYTKTLKENGWDRILVPAKEKFLPLGSPKIDKISSTSCEIKDLPESWQKVVLKPDGTRKKIVLYNLTISGLLSGNEQELKKAKNVFKLFKEKQDEAVLLWRPHPLLLSTIHSMRQQLLDEYLMLVQQFKEEGWGIFDETPNADLAMVLSDAYYGDWSSLIVIYQVMGKPILLQNIYDSEEKDFLSKVIKTNSIPSENKRTVQQKKCMMENVGHSVYHYLMASQNYLNSGE